MPKPRIRKQGTKMLCETLRYIYDVNIETVRDKNASAKDRKEARETADRARSDGLAWGCSWAERV